MSLRHLYVWDCPAEVGFYNPHEKKLNFRIISGYFIGYLKKFKGYMYYCLTHSIRIIKINNVKFIENGEINESDKP